MLFFISTFFTLRCPYDKPPKNHKNERNYTHISSDAPLEHNNARHRPDGRQRCTNQGHLPPWLLENRRIGPELGDLLPESRLH